MTRRTLTTAALALLALALFALPAVVTAALRSPRESSTEVRFVREMTQHHAQAVDMATRIRDRSQDPEIRTVALDILLSQQEQIGQMRGWMTLWAVPWAGKGMDAQHARQMGMATPAELAELDTLPPAQADVRFLQLMTRHHQGALDMVKPALESRVRPEVRALAQRINSTQSAEIRMMTTWLEERGAAPLPWPAHATAPAEPDPAHQH